MNTRDKLTSIGRRVVDCRSYNFGMRNADKLAHEDAPALLAALDAVLAVADVADKRAASNYGEGKLRYEADDQDARAFQALGLCQTQVAHEIRAAVNDALEAGK